MRNIDDLKYDDNGLIPAIVQDARSCEVLMLAFMNRQSIERTLLSGQTHFWSRSRQSLWRKGETSGNTQNVKAVVADCDQDALLVKVEPAGPACHTGARSCFFNVIESAGERQEHGGLPLGALIDELYELILSRKRDRPEGSYTVGLFEKGIDEISKKVGEEAIEAILAAKGGDATQVSYEVADLLYHLLVMLAEVGVTPRDIYQELLRRRR